MHNSAFRGQDLIVGPAFVVGRPDAHAEDTSAPDDLIDILFERCHRCGVYVYFDAESMELSAASGGVCESGEPHTVDPRRTKRYRVHVTVRGETTWRGNELLFTDWFGAYTYSLDLAQRWTSVEHVRVVSDLDDELLDAWHRLGSANPAIADATNPPFTRGSFTGCFSIDELAEWIGRRTWPVGTAFYYRDLCFIQQVADGDDWLVIRRDAVISDGMELMLRVEEGTFTATMLHLLPASNS